MQLALAIMGFYGGLYVVSSIVGAIGGKKKPLPVPVIAHAAHHSTDNAGDIPSVDSPAFGDWIAVSGNMEKFIESAK